MPLLLASGLGIAYLKQETNSMEEVEYQRRDAFPTHMFMFANVDLAIRLKKYISKDKVKGIESGVATEVKKNLDESDFDFLKREDEVIKESVQYFSDSIQIALNDIFQEKVAYKIAFPDSWYHICRKNSSHETHQHSNCSWCGVFYVTSGDADSGGQTVFLSPIGSNFKDEGSPLSNSGIVKVTPEQGTLILFPSYLQHYQSLYTGNSNRITLGFNSIIMERIQS